MILEYKLERGPEGEMTIPYWIEDGGYFHRNKSDFTIIGITQDNPEFHIPSTVIRLTVDELIARELAEHLIFPRRKMLDDTSYTVEMTEEEVIAYVNQWVSEKGLQE